MSYPLPTDDDYGYDMLRRWLETFFDFPNPPPFPAPSYNKIRCAHWGLANWQIQYSNPSYQETYPGGVGGALYMPLYDYGIETVGNRSQVFMYSHDPAWYFEQNHPVYSVVRFTYLPQIISSVSVSVTPTQAPGWCLSTKLPDRWDRSPLPVDVDIPVVVNISNTNQVNVPVNIKVPITFSPTFAPIITSIKPTFNIKVDLGGVTVNFPKSDSGGQPTLPPDIVNKINNINNKVTNSGDKVTNISTTINLPKPEDTVKNPQQEKEKEDKDVPDLHYVRVDVTKLPPKGRYYFTDSQQNTVVFGGYFYWTRGGERLSPEFPIRHLSQVFARPAAIVDGYGFYAMNGAKLTATEYTLAPSPE
jgi:hypothetical protein